MVAPRPRRYCSAETSRGAATATAWIVRGDESRRRRGRDVDRPWRRVAAATAWMFRGDETRRRRGRDVDRPWRRVAAPRPQRGYSAETSRGAVGASPRALASAAAETPIAAGAAPRRERRRGPRRRARAANRRSGEGDRRARGRAVARGPRARGGGREIRRGRAHVRAARGTAAPRDPRGAARPAATPPQGAAAAAAVARGPARDPPVFLRRRPEERGPRHLRRVSRRAKAAPVPLGARRDVQRGYQNRVSIVPVCSRLREDSTRVPTLQTPVKMVLARPRSGRRPQAPTRS